MQKKVKSKLTEFFFVTICLLGTAFSSWKFTTLFFASLNGSETKIAIIELKEKTANRKLLNKVVWDRLRQHSDLYNGDTVRTAPGAKATIHIDDGTVIDLLSNSMVQVFLNEQKQVAAKMDFGTFDIFNVGSNGLTLDANGSSINLQEGTSLSGRKDDDGNLLFQVFNGQIVIQNDNGSYTFVSGDTTILSEDGLPQKTHLKVINPSINARFLNYTTKKTLIGFEWICDDELVLVEISDSKTFENLIVSQKVRSTKRMEIGLNTGTYYWRISTVPNDNDPDSIKESCYGQFSILYSPGPTLVTPKNNEVELYKTKSPAIRFIWEENQYATSYQFELSDKPDMSNIIAQRNQSFSSTVVDDLTEGTYYWRVVPYYMINNTGLGAPSETYTLQVQKKSENAPLRLISPTPKEIVCTTIPIDANTTTHKKINFAWEHNPEAEQYNIKIWKKDSSIIISETSTNNLFTLDTGVKALQNGDWNWQIEMVDSEGHTTSSETREFYATDSEIQQKTLFPPDGYHIVESRSQDLRFSWKTNLIQNTKFQIAKDDTFKNIVVSDTPSSTSFSGRALKEGTYYWRIISKINKKEFATPAKTLIVDPPLPAPISINPVSGGNVVVRPTVPYEFTWNVVPLADYYKIKISRLSNPSVAIFEKNLIESKNGVTASCQFLLDNLPESNYLLTLQAFREETSMSSRASGYLGEYPFILKIIQPIKLISPEDNVTIDGASAIKNEHYIEFTIPDEPATTELVIYKDKESVDNIFMRIPNPKSPYKLPPLREGNYLWKISAFTTDNYDISSLETRRIKITAIPKLHSPSMNEPKKGATFDKDYFKDNKSITFKWGRVSGADQYIFTLKGPNDEILVSEKLSKNVTEYTFTDLRHLPRGRVTWQVEAQSLYNGVLFQEGKVDPSRIKIDLPEIKTPNMKKTGTMYGK